MTSVGLEPLQQKGLRERISPICTLSQNGYGNLMCVTLVALAYLQSIVPSTLFCENDVSGIQTSVTKRLA